MIREYLDNKYQLHRSDFRLRKLRLQSYELDGS
jgi:hypothetical protein